jgi:oligopeptide transport system substrate-binding protein
MRRQRRGVKLLALILGLSLVAAACGGDDDDEGAEESGAAEEEQAEGVQGGELVDNGVFGQGPPEHIDPRINTTVDGFQIGGSVYDGLAETDFSDPENPETVGVVAESWDVNEDATEFVFQIREGLTFSDGEEVLPSSFVRGWESASDPDFAGDYSYLFTFIVGGAEKLDGAAETISGVEADDEEMTLTVNLAAPYANFAAVAGFQTFMPMPDDIDELTDQTEWEQSIMVGNGPFMMEAAANDQQIVLVPNPEWDGTQYDEALGLPEQPFLERITFLIGSDIDTAYNAFEAGEADVTNFAPGRYQEAQDNYATTIDTPFLGAYYFMFNDRDERVGGEENLLLRQAISQAIDREDINADVYEGSRTTATGITPPGIPGFEEGLGDYTTYDPEAAEAAYQEWVDAGNSLDAPLPIQFNADSGHEGVVQIIIDNLAAIGIEAVGEPIPPDDYFGQLAEGACVFCRVGWLADYPTYDNFTFDIFGSEALDGNNYGYISEEFDGLIADAKATTDPDEAGELFRQAEQVLLNDDTGVVPINWYNGQQVYNGDKIASLTEEPSGHVVWETVSLNG